MNSMSRKVSPMKIAKVASTIYNIMVNIGLSYFKCMKKLATTDPLIVAISSAATMPSLPRFIPDTVTVIAVRTSSAIQVTT